jgi:hypothetical protein
MASEILSLATFRGDAASVQALLTVTAGHTYTVLSVTICETAGNAETFEHTGKFVMEAADHLSIITASTSNIDVCVSYLDQTL